MTIDISTPFDDLLSLELRARKAALQASIDAFVAAREAERTGPVLEAAIVAHEQARSEARRKLLGAGYRMEPSGIIEVMIDAHPMVRASLAVVQMVQGGGTL